MFSPLLKGLPIVLALLPVKQLVHVAPLRPWTLTVCVCVRERESVCVCVRERERLRASHLMMGVTARFVKGVVLEAAGMQTEGERRWALFFHSRL